MKLKPRSTTLNQRALLYRRFTSLERSENLQTVYYTTSTATYWTFNSQTLTFMSVAQTLIPTTSIIKTITDLTTILQFQSHYFNYTGSAWQEITNLPSLPTLLSASFNNIGKYQTNKYYFVGSFDYMIRGSIEGTTTQFIRGNITPLTSLNIKHFNDDIKITVDDLVVIDKRLFSVENPETVQKRQPKPFNVHFATLNSIL